MGPYWCKCEDLIGQGIQIDAQRISLYCMFYSLVVGLVQKSSQQCTPRLANITGHILQFGQEEFYKVRIVPNQNNQVPAEGLKGSGQEVQLAGEFMYVNEILCYNNDRCAK